MDDKRIGQRNADGKIERYPETSISGQAYEMPPTQICHLGSGRFVILDIFPPRDFDTHAAVAELRGQAQTVAPEVRTSQKGKPNTDGTEVENA